MSDNQNFLPKMVLYLFHFNVSCQYLRVNVMKLTCQCFMSISSSLSSYRKNRISESENVTYVILICSSKEYYQKHKFNRYSMLPMPMKNVGENFCISVLPHASAMRFRITFAVSAKLRTVAKVRAPYNITSTKRSSHSLVCTRSFIKFEVF